ncbi:hypothetical protein BDR06DRAFT_983999 [Suillus hirtellus]|nr:hypothetical protein BDR06DRAFT_983999 [Suillus hirtellus]
MAHKDHPLHQLQKWNSDYFESASLKSLGLQIQLGHTLGHTCPNPCHAFNDDFDIIDSHGMHEVLLDFCDCTLVTTHIQQLLYISLFPLTTADLKTAATFCLLEEFHVLSLKSKVSAYKFYYALMQRSDNTGITLIKDQYNSFIRRMVCEWHYLKMLKQSERAHDPNGIDATTQGACVREVPSTKSWIYGLFVAIDTNFWLKQKVMSRDSMDPSLSNGWRYFVEESAYKAFLNDNSNVNQEKSTCSSHNAVNLADTKSNCGLAVTGLGTIDCAHHNMKLLTAHTMVDVLNNKNLWHRMMSFPPSMQLNLDTKKFSFNLAPGVGQMDGEAPERGWANINPVALSTKEMDPGVTGLCHMVLCKMKDALPELSEHEAALDDLEEALKEEYSEVLSRWKEEVKAWEHDPSQPNPYKQSIKNITLASMRLELAKEEASKIELGASHMLHEDCLPSMLISSGLELKEQQADKANLGTHAMDTQEEKLVQHSNTHDTLCSLCSNLHMQTAVLKYKDRNLCSQGANTRVHNTLKGIDARIIAASSRYQNTHIALVVLTPLIKETGWQSSLYCKARAHAMWWKKEFFDWQATSWDECMNQSWSKSSTEREGEIAYAWHQATLHCALLATCHSTWEDTCTFVDQFHAHPSALNVGHF